MIFLGFLGLIFILLACLLLLQGYVCYNTDWAGLKRNRIIFFLFSPSYFWKGSKRGYRIYSHFAWSVALFFLIIGLTLILTGYYLSHVSGDINYGQRNKMPDDQVISSPAVLGPYAQEPLSVSADGEITIPDSYQKCTTDKDCGIVTGQCGYCFAATVSIDRVDEYKTSFKKVCSSYQGVYCELAATKYDTECVKGKCMLLVGDVAGQ